MNENIEIILTRELKDCDRITENIAKMREALPKLIPILNTLPSLRFCYYYPSTAAIIMGVETRADLATVRALHNGVWLKSVSPNADDPNENVRYEATVDGIKIDIRVTELPPSCKVVETRKLVPEHVVTIRRVVCNEPGKDTANLPDKIISVEPAQEIEVLEF